MQHMRFIHYIELSGVENGLALVITVITVVISQLIRNI